MDDSHQLDLGWLVVDEHGAVTHWSGEIPRILVSRKSKNSAGLPSDCWNWLGNGDIAEGIEQVRLGNIPKAEGELRIGGRQKAKWTARPLAATDGAGSILLTLQKSKTSRARLNGKNCSDPFHQSTVGMFRTALNGKLLEINAALARLCGYRSADELTEKLRNNGRQLYVKRHRRLEFVAQMRTQGVVEDFQSEIYRADGTKIWIAEFARTVTDSKGHALFYEGTAFDITSHKEATSALHGSREQFRRLLETSNVVPWEGDIDGRIRYVGPQAELLLGYSMDDWLRPGFWDERIHPEDREWVKIVREEAIENLGRFESEYRMLKSSGEVMWVRDIVSLIEAAKGELILGGFLHDITHRRAAEESLRESQDFIEQIARASPLIWYVFDADLQRVVYLNGGGIDALGLSKEELLNLQPSFTVCLAHPDELDAHTTHFQKLLNIRRGERVEREFRVRATSGRWVWLRTHETALKVDDKGRTRQVVGIAEDITFQQAALEDLANNEALYRRLAETTRVIPFELEFEPINFTYIGPQAEALLGFPLRNWTSHSFWSSVVHPEDLADVERSFAEALTKPEAHVEVEYRLLKQNGEFCWVRQILRCEMHQEKHSRGRGFFVDISATKEMEREREESRRQLRQLALENQRVREEERLALSREIHDELGQSLTLLRLDLTWMGKRISKSLRSSSATALLTKVHEMEKQIAATLQIVRRIATQLRPPVLDEFGLAEAIEWQANEFSRRVGLRCEVSTQFSECACKETATMVFRVFQELLTNVAKHSKASRVKVFLKQMSGIIYLSVSDNGCGFEISPGKRKSGFGLLGMRERAESVRGRLQIESAVGVGTTVTLCVPHNLESREGRRTDG
jgi:PAS domain S-box-containing protein